MDYSNAWNALDLTWSEVNCTRCKEDTQICHATPLVRTDFLNVYVYKSRRLGFGSRLNSGVMKKCQVTKQGYNVWIHRKIWSCGQAVEGKFNCTILTYGLQEPKTKVALPWMKTTASPLCYYWVPVLIQVICHCW